ncbi:MULTISPECIES: MurR/RpiR family transcriptional regulator [Staphylococcus]|uniref:MurR/RpiR family transcriptional regulator n=1 Tax=Staphylococcus TaxID=1279 RepID=UPI000764413C|nr:MULTISPECIES: MurR/RpiR family transcriptional regulator [Staphylococcus]KXA42529.1 SIS domain protein [Staphylococcus simulans]MDQ7112703.1 MurR/RpiR family transcriptional regulator [Staphylococcus simulans]MDQ7116551.1 MurR/RpiR family transcriptional regulator [Staphylococcus simulans]OFM16527.1 RpiR family transcriptional regulator [Staphylococcus sp. HMSC059E03]OFN20447.1 RpiR family transcriptional regulator [Staphylococcus sp. HMSC055C03]
MGNEQLLIYIEEQMEQLTKNEQQVARYLIEAPEAILEMSAQALGKETQTSSATVIRCVHKLGFKGLVDLKLAISSYLPNHQASVYQEMEQDEPANEIKSKLFNRAAYTLKTTETLLDDQTLETIAEKLRQCKKLVVFGVGASHIVAEDIFQKFTRAGMNVVHSSDAHIIATTLAGSNNEGTLMIGISNSGQNRETLKLAQVARHYHVPVIGMTSRKDSELANEADECLFHDASSDRSLRLAATSSLIAQLITVDTLFYTYLAKDYTNHIAHLSQTRDAVDLYVDGD